MSTAVATIDRQPRSVLVDMSARYGMEPAAFEATLRATVCKGSVSREEFAAFLLVAKEYRLNPLTKEIYAFPAKGGGIQPIVSIDGWCRIINEHPALDGIEFEDMLADDGALLAVTCRIYRKDRQRPTSVTEYMSECRRSTDVWKTWPARMLRHKALIQGARYAFGFSGIVDPDEYERAIEARDVTPQTSGLMERLPGASNGQGFHAQVVERAIGTEQPLDPQEVDAILDGDTIPNHDPETGEVIDAEVEAQEAPQTAEFTDAPDTPANPETRASGDAEPATAPSEAEPTAGLADADFDHVEWSGAFVRSLENLDTIEEVNTAWEEAKTKGFVFKVKAKSPNLAKQVADACTARVAAIKAAGGAG